MVPLLDSFRLRKARALPWTRWGLRPQTPISAARLFITFSAKPINHLDSWLRRSPNNGGLGPQSLTRIGLGTAYLADLICKGFSAVRFKPRPGGATST